MTDHVVMPIACRLDDRNLAKRSSELAAGLFADVEEVRELPDGYAFRFPATAGLLARLAEFVEFERSCCPFLSFEIAAAPDHGPFWLRLRGGDGVKAFVGATFAADLMPSTAETDAGTASAAALPWTSDRIATR